jgi:hypothetical protein
LGSCSSVAIGGWVSRNPSRMVAILSDPAGEIRFAGAANGSKN